MAKVALDAGHGGSNPGEVFYSRLEKNDNLRLALRVGQLLEQDRIDVFYTRSQDTRLSQPERAELANLSEADLLVSLHRIFGRGAYSEHGLGFFVRPEDSESLAAAENIGKSLSKIGYQRYGITERTDVPTLNDTNMPAVMIGIGYMGSEEENQYFDENFEAIARAIADGIEATLKELNIQEVYEALEFGQTVYKPVDRVSCDLCKSSHQDISNSKFHIQTGVYRNYDHAMEHQFHFIYQGLKAEIVRKGERFAVWVGECDNLDEAAFLELLLHRLGYETLLVS